MTVPIETRSVEYDGDGLATDFPIPFAYLEDAHVRVTYTPAVGASSVLVNGANPGYIISDGNVKDCYPVSASVPCETGATITVERVVPITQTLDLVQAGTLDAEVLEENLDKTVMGLQQLQDRVAALEGGTLPAMAVGDGLETIAGPTLQVKEHSDGSIAVGTGGVQVGVLATDAQHGVRGGGTQHANAVSGGAAGFMSGTDKQRADALWARTITAGAGLTGGGDLSANRTLDVGANADGSIVVNANDIQVGILATDAQHGVRGGGTQHAEATTSVAGFMSAADKTKLDGLVSESTLEGTTSTSDATVTAVLSWTPTDNTTEALEVVVVARRKSGTGSDGDSAVYFQRLGVRRNGSTAILPSAAPAVSHSAESEDVAGWAVDVSVAASPQVTVRVTGAAATVVNWACRVRRLIVSET